MPYFSTIFKDIAMRRQSPKKKNDKVEMVDKAAFYEYTQLPGIINDRFFSQFKRTKDDHILEECFVDGLRRVYLDTI